MRKILSALLAAVGLAGCSQLTAFDTVAPKDPARLLAGDVTYGPQPREQLDVYGPPKAGGDLPVVVFFYGGGWNSGRRQDYSFAARAIASRGFVTVVPDYRLYPDVTYPAFLEDGAAAIKWVQDNVARYGGDASRIVLAGHSAGAYNAVELTLDPQWLLAAGADPSAIRGVAGLAGPYDFLPLDVQATKDSFGDVADLAATQPINHARADAPPLFLAQGLKDDTVATYNPEHLAAALEKAGAPEPEVKLYPRVNHAGLVLALSRPFRGKAPLLADMTAFIRQVTGQPASE